MSADLTVDTSVEYGLYALAVRLPDLFAEAEQFIGGTLAEDQDALRRVKALIAKVCPAARCTCPAGWGHVVANGCPVHDPRPKHTVSEGFSDIWRDERP